VLLVSYLRNDAIIAAKILIRRSGSSRGLARRSLDKYLAFDGVQSNHVIDALAKVAMVVDVSDEVICGIVLMDCRKADCHVQTTRTLGLTYSFRRRACTGTGRFDPPS
jgi:hypothetical protein